MTKIWAPWLMTLFLALQFTAVATDAHQLVPAEDKAGSLVEIASDCLHANCPDANIEGAVDTGSDAEHCPHCCHCNCHAVSSTTFFGGERISTTAPPYRATFHSTLSSTFFRPPKRA